MKCAGATRLFKEYIMIQSLPSDGILISPVDKDDLFHWIGEFKGPQNTPYESGYFYLDIKIPNEYPFKPPVVRFKTRIYHPDVNSQGKICEPILLCDWNPSIQIIDTIIKCRELLENLIPNDDGFVPEIANLMVTDREKFNDNARNYTQKYAIKEDY